MKRFIPVLAFVLATAACDDSGPAGVHGTNTPPAIAVSVDAGGVYAAYDGAPDTVGMLRPFAISYHGVPPGFNRITGYRFAPWGTQPIDAEWNTDVADTLREFPNHGGDALASGEYRAAVQCRDQENESEWQDVTIIVNFDPDTRFTRVSNFYWKGGMRYERDIDFRDTRPDTVSYKSWVKLTYRGWDDARDGNCLSNDPDRCVVFQLRYDRASARVQGSTATSGWLPRGGTMDTDPTSATDSNSVNIGTVEYDFYARTIDGNSRPDGTPARVSLVGNHDPVLDDVTLVDHFGNELDLAAVDTLTWNFWRGEGWPYTAATDTVDITMPGFPYFKKFSFRLGATGHDHPDDPDGSNIKAWRYLIFDEDGNNWPLAHAGPTWRDADIPGLLDDTFEKTFYYGSFQTGQGANGDELFAAIPGYLNHDLTVVLLGRDTSINEPEFQQFVFLNGEATTMNLYPTAAFGRWTKERTFKFHFRMVR